MDSAAHSTYSDCTSSRSIRALFIPAYSIQGRGELEFIQAVIGQEAWCTPDTLPVHHRADTHRQTHSFTLAFESTGNLGFPFHHPHVFEGGSSSNSSSRFMLLYAGVALTVCWRLCSYVSGPIIAFYVLPLLISWISWLDHVARGGPLLHWFRFHTCQNAASPGPWRHGSLCTSESFWCPKSWQGNQSLQSSISVFHWMVLNLAQAPVEKGVLVLESKGSGEKFS